MPNIHFAVAFKGASWSDPDSVALMVMQVSHSMQCCITVPLLMLLLGLTVPLLMLLLGITVPLLMLLLGSVGYAAHFDRFLQTVINTCACFVMLLSAQSACLPFANESITHGEAEP